MKGLPSDIDLSALVDLEVAQVCFGTAPVMTIRFDKDVELTIESDCVLTTSTGQVEAIEEFRTNANRICALLGEHVVKASRDDSGGLMLKFQSGAMFNVSNDNVAYESFQLRIGSQLFVA